MLLELIEGEGSAVIRRSTLQTSLGRSFCTFVGIWCGVTTLTHITIRACVKYALYELRMHSRLLEKPTVHDKGSTMGSWVFHRLHCGAYYACSLVVRSVSVIGWFAVRLLFLARGDDQAHACVLTQRGLGTRGRH